MKLVFVALCKNTAIRRKNKDWLAPKQDNVSEWVTCLSLTVVSVNYHTKNPTKHVDLVQSGPHHHHLIEI